MQYLVQVGGIVTDKQSKAYVIDSKSEQDAEVIAREKFKEEFATDCDVVYSKSQERTKRAILAFVFMAIPVLLSLVEWTSGHNKTQIQPNLVSCMFSAVIYLAFIVRFKGVQRTISSWIDMVFSALSILLISSFVRMIITTKTTKLFGLIEIGIDTTSILVIATILSWLGLKAVSLMCFAVVAVCALSSIITLNDAMKMWGPVYVISSFLGILMYLSIEPAWIESKLYMKHFSAKSRERISNDIQEAKHEVISAKNTVTEQIEKKKKAKKEAKKES